MGIHHKSNRPNRPQTNGKAQGFIESALREWAYGFSCQSSSERTAALDCWQHHYNWRRPHPAIGGVVRMSRLNRSRNKLLTLHVQRKPDICCTDSTLPQFAAHVPGCIYKQHE